MRRLALAPPDELGDLLSADELDALVGRAAGLVRRPFFPAARSHWAYPWPLI